MSTPATAALAAIADFIAADPGDDRLVPHEPRPDGTPHLVDAPAPPLTQDAPTPAPRPAPEQDEDAYTTRPDEDVADDARTASVMGTPPPSPRAAPAAAPAASSTPKRPATASPPKAKKTKKSKPVPIATEAPPVAASPKKKKKKAATTAAAVPSPAAPVFVPASPEVVRTPPPKRALSQPPGAPGKRVPTTPKAADSDDEPLATADGGAPPPPPKAKKPRKPPKPILSAAQIQAALEAKLAAEQEAGKEQRPMRHAKKTAMVKTEIIKQFEYVQAKDPKAKLTSAATDGKGGSKRKPDRDFVPSAKALAKAAKEAEEDVSADEEEEGGDGEEKAEPKPAAAPASTKMAATTVASKKGLRFVDDEAGVSGKKRKKNDDEDEYEDDGEEEEDDEEEGDDEEDEEGDEDEEEEEEGEGDDEDEDEEDEEVIRKRERHEIDGGAEGDEEDDDERDLSKVDVSRLYEMKMEAEAREVEKAARAEANGKGKKTPLTPEEQAVELELDRICHWPVKKLPAVDERGFVFRKDVLLDPPARWPDAKSDPRATVDPQRLSLKMELRNGDPVFTYGLITRESASGKEGFLPMRIGDWKPTRATFGLPWKDIAAAHNVRTSDKGESVPIMCTAAYRSRHKRALNKSMLGKLKAPAPAPGVQPLTNFLVPKTNGAAATTKRSGKAEKAEAGGDPVLNLTRALSVVAQDSCAKIPEPLRAKCLEVDAQLLTLPTSGPTVADAVTKLVTAKVLEKVNSNPPGTTYSKEDIIRAVETVGGGVLRLLVFTNVTSRAIVRKELGLDKPEPASNASAMMMDF